MGRGGDDGQVEGVEDKLMEMDINMLRIRKWKQVVKYRNRWKKIINETMGLLGSQC